MWSTLDCSHRRSRVQTEAEIRRKFHEYSAEIRNSFVNPKSWSEDTSEECIAGDFQIQIQLNGFSRRKFGGNFTKNSRE